MNRKSCLSILSDIVLARTNFISLPTSAINLIQLHRTQLGKGWVSWTLFLHNNNHFELVVRGVPQSRKKRISCGKIFWQQNCTLNTSCKTGPSTCQNDTTEPLYNEVYLSLGGRAMTNPPPHFASHFTRFSHLQHSHQTTIHHPPAYYLYQ